MTQGATVRMTGVLSPGVSPGLLVGTVTGGDDPETLVGTVDRSLIESYDGDTVYYRARLKIDGTWVDAEDILDGITLSEGLDTPITMLTFRLAGPEWAHAVTEQTWTRTPVELYVTRGTPDDVQAEELWLTGYVHTGSEGTDAGGPTDEVQAYNTSGKLAEYLLCHEVEPHSGLYRGEIVETLLEAAGITDHDVPRGAEYKKGLFTDSAKLWEFVLPFVEPEGWQVREKADGGIVVWEPKLKRYPEPPDHEWGPGDWFIAGRKSVPPTDVPNRWVIRGTSALRTDLLGQEVSTETVEIKEIYAPKIAVQQQDTAGAITSTGFSAESEVLRTVRKIVTTTTKRGNLILSQNVEEWSWYNPRKAQLRTPNGAEPDGPAGGYYYVASYIDEDGEYRMWKKERFLRTGIRRQEFSYDNDSNLTSGIERIWGYFGRTAGVKPAPAGASWVAHQNVASDGMSYSDTDPESGVTDLRQIDYWTQGEEHHRTFVYAADGGPLIKEQVDSWGYYSAQSAIDTSGLYVRYDGSGQADVVAPFQLFSTKTKWNILSSDYLLQGELEREERYAVSHRVGGTYDWGEFSSERVSESFQVAYEKNTVYNILSEDSYEKVTHDSDGESTVEVILGRLPYTRYQTSAWTRLVQEPIELEWSDPTLLAWFGTHSEVLSNSYIQDLSEAQKLLGFRLGRELAFSHTISRPLTLARKGDTVRLSDPASGLDVRALVVGLSVRFAADGSVDATYDLEEPIL